MLAVLNGCLEFREAVPVFHQVVQVRCTLVPGRVSYSLGKMDWICAFIRRRVSGVAQCQPSWILNVPR